MHAQAAAAIAASAALSSAALAAASAAIALSSAPTSDNDDDIDLKVPTPTQTPAEQGLASESIPTISITLAVRTAKNFCQPEKHVMTYVEFWKRFREAFTAWAHHQLQARRQRRCLADIVRDVVPAGKGTCVVVQVDFSEKMMLERNNASQGEASNKVLLLVACVTYYDSETASLKTQSWFFITPDQPDDATLTTHCMKLLVDHLKSTVAPKLEQVLSYACKLTRWWAAGGGGRVGSILSDVDRY